MIKCLLLIILIITTFSIKCPKIKSSKTFQLNFSGFRLGKISRSMV